MLFGELPWAVQWLRLHSFNAGSRASISGWGIKILHAAQHGQKNFFLVFNKINAIFKRYHCFFLNPYRTLGQNSLPQWKFRNLNLCFEISFIKMSL